MYWLSLLISCFMISRSSSLMIHTRVRKWKLAYDLHSCWHLSPEGQGRNVLQFQHPHVSVSIFPHFHMSAVTWSEETWHAWVKITCCSARNEGTCSVPDEETNLGWISCSFRLVSADLVLLIDQAGLAS